MKCNKFLSSKTFWRRQERQKKLLRSRLLKEVFNISLSRRMFAGILVLLWAKRSIKKYFKNPNLTMELNKIRTGITSKKIPCYMYVSACRWQNYFEVMLSIFEIPHTGKKYRVWIGLCKHNFINLPIVFLQWNNETKLGPAF